MRTPELRIKLLVVTLALGWVAAPAVAQEVGKFAVVQNQVSSKRPGATEAVPAVIGAPIVIQESEITGPASRAKLVFGEGAVISIGQNTTFEVSQQAVDQATGKSTSSVSVAQGNLRVFVSRFWGGRPEVEVNTPTAVVGIKGSEVLVEVTDGKTVVTVFGGSAEVRAKTGGRSVTLTVAQQVEVTSAGGVGNPIVVDSAALAGLWEMSEPIPQPPLEFPTQRPVLPPPDPLDRATLIAADCLTCPGSTPMADPAGRATGDVPSGPGEPINSGTKAGRR